MIVTRTPMTINKVVSLSGQVHLISVKKNKVFHNQLNSYLKLWFTSSCIPFLLLLLPSQVES